MQVTFRPLDFGARQATLGVNIPLGLGNTGNVTPLTGDGISQWAVFDQNDLVFGGTLISLASAPAPVNLSNQGTVSQLIQQVMLGGSNASDFRIISDRCSDRMLAPSESCLLGISFVPTATGQRQAELEITAAGGVFAIPVQGPGLGPVAQLSANGLIFDEIKYDSTGMAPAGEIPVSGDVVQSITLSNVGQAPLQLEGVEVTGDFVLENNGCAAAPLQPSDACEIQVRLNPVHFQFQTGSLLIYDNTSDSPHEVSLSGSVEAAIASLVADELQFGVVPIGTTSAPQMIELENLEGDAPLHIESISATGDFTASSDCPTDLAIGRCTITVTVTPTQSGTRRGFLQVTDNAPGSPQQIPLVAPEPAGGPTAAGTLSVLAALALRRRNRDR